MFQNEITKEEVEGLELIQFEGPVRVVDTLDAFYREIGQIEGNPLLGFDTETRPSFKKGKVYPTSLIQMATDFSNNEDAATTRTRATKLVKELSSVALRNPLEHSAQNEVLRTG